MENSIPLPVPAPATCCLGPTTTLPPMEEISEEPGHTGIEGNEGADKLAAEGALKNPDREDIDLQIPADIMVTGAALVTNTVSYLKNITHLPGNS